MSGAEKRSGPIPTDVTFFANADEIRAWFDEHAEHTNELWVGFYNQASGKGGITYKEAVDEALCVGWIDGIRKKLDADSYTNRFTPRKPRSIWSAVNIQRVGELTALGRMRPAGLRAFESRDLRDQGQSPSSRVRSHSTMRRSAASASRERPGPTSRRRLLPIRRRRSGGSSAPSVPRLVSAASSS